MIPPASPLSTLRYDPSRDHRQDSRPEWSRFSFSVGLFHPLQCAGLSRRSLSLFLRFPPKSPSDHKSLTTNLLRGRGPECMGVFQNRRSLQNRQNPCGKYCVAQKQTTAFCLLIPHQSTRLVRRELLQKLRLRFRLLRHPIVRRSLFRKLFGGMRISREAILQWRRIRGICKKGFLP